MKQTYQNPMKLDQEWEDYGIGDPFVLRFNGKYYLYCSTKDRRVGIKSWSSEDLIHWQYEGLVTEDPLTEGAYAPEVVYWNGSFYMYTSPAGNGHYVLRSDNPTGPFKVQTDNLGLSIDGSVFIDDDAKWYFTNAASGGIMASLMEDPYTIGPGDKLNTSLGHWTEGSMILKRQGRYFITYTGNHVFSRGYRVNYAVAHDSPNGIYTIPENNPILISTKEDFNGLGHSSTVMGPDMDSYYIVYHNLIGRSAEGPPVRMMNIDRLLFNGDKMSVAGPTYGMPVQAPERPAFYDYVAGVPREDHWEHQETQQNKETWISKASTGSKFTTEFNAVISDREDQTTSGPRTFEALFSYHGTDQFRGIRVDMETKTLSLFEADQGKERVVHTGDLPKGMDLTKHHTLRVESDQAGTWVYWDGLLLLSDEQMKGEAGAIGYRWSTALKPTLSYTAFSNEARGSSDHKVLHPLPGTMEAIHGIPGEDEGQAFSMNDENTPDGSYSVTLTKNDSELSFPVYVKEEGTYLISAMVAKDSAGGKMSVHAGGKGTEIKLKAEDFSNESEWSKIPLASFHLGEGPQWISLSKEKGEVSIRYIEVSKTVPAPSRQTVEFTAQFGNWDLSGEQITLLSQDREGKLFGGDPGWSDYEVNFQMTHTEEAPSKAALLLRTSNESDFKDQVADSFMGYELSFNNGFVRLNRIGYEVNEEVASELLELENNKALNIRVQLEGAVISVFIGDSKNPLLTWTDPNAFLTGRVGLRTASKGWLFSPITVSPIK